MKYKQQNPGETLQQFAKLVHLAVPTAPTEFLNYYKGHLYIDAKRDIEIQPASRLPRLSKMEEALARVLEFEAAKQSSRTYLLAHQVRQFANKGI